MVRRSRRNLDPTVAIADRRPLVGIAAADGTGEKRQEGARELVEDADRVWFLVASTSQHSSSSAGTIVYEEVPAGVKIDTAFRP